MAAVYAALVFAKLYLIVPLPHNWSEMTCYGRLGQLGAELSAFRAEKGRLPFNRDELISYMGGPYDYLECPEGRAYVLRPEGLRGHGPVVICRGHRTYCINWFLVTVVEKRVQLELWPNGEVRQRRQRR